MSTMFVYIYGALLVSTGLVLCEDKAPPSRGTRVAELTKYILCTRSNRNGEVITAGSDKVNVNNNLMVLVHGHEGSADSTFNILVRDEFLVKDANNAVLVVDWHVYASFPYVSAAGLASAIGQGIGEFLNKFDTELMDNLHLVGFDIGAHIVGVAGRYLNGQVARITGLDPTGLSFDSSNSNRLRESDAKYVEVIHTDTTGVQAIGTSDRLGHVDFFPNGGTAQPGCSGNICNHERAYELFSATINNDKLVGNLCYTTTQLTTNACTSFALNMGNILLEKFGSGIFRLTTGRTYPFEA